MCVFAFRRNSYICKSFYMNDSTDRSTTELIRNGNKPAFEAVFRLYYKRLCSYATLFVSDSDAAEEVVQETFFRFWSGRESLPEINSLQSYLFRAVHNQCLNQLKHAQYAGRYAGEKQPDLELEQQKHSDPAVIGDLKQQIAAALEKLPTERKRIFLMIRFEGMKYREVAETLGISVKTVENQMGSAIKFLKEELREFLPVILLFLSIIFSEQIGVL